MSDMEDWEKAAEDDAALDSIIKTGKFGDEIITPVVEEVKQVVVPQPAKKKLGENFGKNKKRAVAEVPEGETPQEREKRIAEGKLQEEIADNRITEDLFDVKPVTILSTDDNYLEYAREVSRGLHKGLYHFRLPVFYRELLSETTSLMSADDISKIIAQLTIIHTKKVRDEKGTGKKAKNTKPVLKNDLKKDDPGEDNYDDYEDFL